MVEQLTSLMLGDSDVECARKALHALIAAAGFNALNERWGPHISAPDRAASASADGLVALAAGASVSTPSPRCSLGCARCTPLEANQQCSRTMYTAHRPCPRPSLERVCVCGTTVTYYGLPAKQPFDHRLQAERALPELLSSHALLLASMPHVLPALRAGVADGATEAVAMQRVVVRALAAAVGSHMLDRAAIAHCVDVLLPEMFSLHAIGQSAHRPLPPPSRTHRP